jgi:hypothetical protein
LRAGDRDCDVVQEVTLKEGERVVGVEGISIQGKNSAKVADLQFVIGWLE